MAFEEVQFISGGHRLLEPGEIDKVAAECEQAWQDSSIPEPQLKLVLSEIQSYRDGKPQPHFEVLLRTLRKTGLFNPTLLDVGAASGYYSEVLRLGGFTCQYTALDYSDHCRQVARLFFPGITFDLGDARALPYPAGFYDIVLSGCCIVHIRDYERVVQESARVAKQFVVLNRTPIVLNDSPTRFYEKEAYGSVRCLEIHFNEDELIGLCQDAGLERVSSETIFVDKTLRYAHKTYLLRKTNV